MTYSVPVTGCLIFLLMISEAFAAASPAAQMLRVLVTQSDTAEPLSSPKGGVSSGEQNTSSDSAAALKTLVEKIRNLEAEVERLKSNQGVGRPTSTTDGQCLFFVDMAHVGIVPTQNGPTRYLAIHLTIANTTAKPITLTRQRIVAEIDGESLALEEIPKSVAQFSFQVSRQSYALNSMQPVQNRTVPAKGQASFWIVYSKLSAGTTVPQCKLHLSFGDTHMELNVNDQQRAILGLQSERIGPRGSVALLTICGLMTTVNSQSLCDEFENLAAQKITRLVLRWNSEAPQPDHNILDWLEMSAATRGQPRPGNDLFPAIPAGIREFHLVKFHKNETPSEDDGSARKHVPPQLHLSDADAVGASLRSVYLAMPRDELLAEIRDGHPLSRAAALSYGGGRLDTEHLPQIFRWIEEGNPEIQRAALQTLSHFGESEAVQRLVFYVKCNADPLSTTAMESLAGSRFGAAHEALLELLKNEAPDSKKQIAKVLAKYPRPIWSETLYEFAADSHASMRLEALKALTQVGHPRLIDILEAGLKSDENSVKDFSFRTLAERIDDRSEALAMDYTLNQLKVGAPDGTMCRLLIKTKDPRALPLLLGYLDSKSNNRMGVLKLLIQIGDSAVIETLAEKYPSLPLQDQMTVLNGLKQFRHPKFHDYAGAALLSSDISLVSTAANALMQEGHPDGEKLLIEALNKQSAGNLIPNIANALASFGTLTARKALLQVKDSQDQIKGKHSTNALVQMRQRSPGLQFVLMALQRLQSPPEKNDLKGQANLQAEALEFCDAAIQVDPYLGEAYAVRGKVRLQQENWDETATNFEKALELMLDDDSEIITGLGLARVAQGKLEDGIKVVEDHREKFKDTKDGLYCYNVACVYSRACEYLDQHPDAQNQQLRRDEYRGKSLADLKLSVHQGFREFDWMAEDPDFAVIREDPDFQKLIVGRGSKTPKEAQPQQSTEK